MTPELRRRLEAVALEMRSLWDLRTTADCTREETIAVNDILRDIENYEYDRAIAKARGNWEPPSPPGFEGGFAENH